MRFKAPAIAVAAVSLSMLAACGGSGSDTTSPSITTGPEGGGGTSSSSAPNLGGTGSAQDPNRKGPVTIDGATEGGTVTVLTNGGLTTTLDPTEIYYTDTSSIMSGLVVRSLTQYVYDPATKGMTLVPDLAVDLGQHNDDYTKWDFKIRDDAKYEDGTPVTAADIVFGIKRSFDRDTFPTGADYSNQYFEGGNTAKTPYMGPYSDPKGKFTAAKVVDGDTVEINMAKPFPDMPYWGAFPAMGPIPSGDASDPKTYLNHPLATGPYMFKSFTASKELVLTKNPEWDPASDPGRTQYPDGYDFKTQQDPAKLDQIIIGDSGTGQTTLTYDNLQSADFNTLQKQDPSRIVTGLSPCTYYIAPDYRKIKDIKIREALTWAYPYKDALLAGGEIPGVTVYPANNLLPPGLPGQNPDFNPLDHGDFQTDAAKSQELLKEANATGYEIKFLFISDDPTRVKVKDAIVKGLEAGGFKATPVSSTLATYADDRANTKSDINMRSGGWCSDWPSGASWIPPVLGSTDPDTSGSFGSNLSAFSEPSVDKQIDAIQKMKIEDQPAAWESLDEDIFTKYYPLTPTYYAGVVLARGSKINGMNNDNVFGMPTWKNIYVG